MDNSIRLYPYTLELRSPHGFEVGAVVLQSRQVQVESPFEPHSDGRVYPLDGLAGLQDEAVKQFLCAGLLVTRTDATSMPRGQVFPVTDKNTGVLYHAKRI